MCISILFWYDRTYRAPITASLRRLHRPDLLRQIFKIPATRE